MLTSDIDQKYKEYYENEFAFEFNTMRRAAFSMQTDFYKMEYVEYDLKQECLKMAKEVPEDHINRFVEVPLQQESFNILFTGEVIKTAQGKLKAIVPC